MSVYRVLASVYSYERILGSYECVLLWVCTVYRALMSEYTFECAQGSYERIQGSYECVLSSAQGWNNRTLISHELLICSKMCFSKTEPVQ